MYNKDELEIVDYIENENPKSVVNLSDKIGKIKSSLHAKYTKRKAINVKVLESDLEKLNSSSTTL